MTTPTTTDRSRCETATSLLRTSGAITPVVMGILNVTPDSFSDGGAYLDPTTAIDRAQRMIEEGADIVDVGPESTRPGSQPVSADEQLRRAVPVVQGIRERNADITISIDTRFAEVAERAIESGADIVNDTSALRDDPTMADCVARTAARVVLMHRRGTPETMQAHGGPQYSDVVGEVCDFLRERVRFAIDRGIDPSCILVDPGIGFGKRVEHNSAILRNVAAFGDVGPPDCPRIPVLIGASRKRFLGSLIGVEDPAGRDAASAICAVLAAQNGAAVLRVHDVRGTVDAISLWRHIMA